MPYSGGRTRVPSNGGLSGDLGELAEAAERVAHVQEQAQTVCAHGSVVGQEYWGLKTMAYKIHKNRKGHYAYVRSNAPAPAVQEMERLMRLHEDVMRVLTVKVDAHEEGPSAVLQARSQRDDRGDRGDRDRGDRDRDRGPRRPRREDEN